MFIDLHGTNAAVAAILTALDYDARVSGDPTGPIADARWDVQVVAIPREREDLRPQFERAVRQRAAP